MKKGALGIVILVFLAAIIGSGCGGDSSTASDGSGAVTKAQFVKEANAVCVKGEKRRFAVMTAIGRTFDPDEDVTKSEKGDRLVLAGVAVYKEMAEELAALEPPAGEEEAVEDIIAKMETAVEKAEAEPKAVFNGDAVFGPAQKASRAYGLEECLGG